MKLSFWNRWWLWAAIAIGIIVSVGIASCLKLSNWGEQFSANLFSDLIVGVAVGVGVVGWLQRSQKGKERGERTAKVLKTLHEELTSNIELLDEWFGPSKKGPGPLPSRLRMGGWSAIAAGPLLDTVPDAILPDLLSAYALAEEVNVLVRRYSDSLFESWLTPSKEMDDHLKLVSIVLKVQCDNLKPLMQTSIHLIEPYLDSEQEESP